MTRKVTSRFVLQGDNQLATAFNRARVQMNALTLKAAVFSTAMAAGVATVVRSQSQYIDQLAKTSDFVGVSVEALQSLRYAAELTGVSAAGLDDSMRRLNRRAGEFANSGGGPAAKAFEALKISVRDANDQVKSSETLFDEIVVAMQGVETDSQRAALAAQLFGDDFGPKMVPLLNQGIDGINEARRTFESLHGVITESEAAGVERMNDAMTTAQLVGQGLARNYTAALAPAITAIADQFIAASRESGGFKEQAIEAAEGTVRAVAFIINGIEGVRRVFQVWGRSIAVTFAAIELGAWQLADSIINGPGRALDWLIEKANQIPRVDIDFRFGVAVPQLEALMGRAAGIVREGVADIHDVLMQEMPGADLIANFERVRDEMAKATRRKQKEGGGTGDPLGLGTGALGEEAKRAQQIIAQTRNEYERFAEAANEAYALLNQGLIDEDTFNRWIELHRVTVDEVEGLASQAHDSMTVYAEQAARNMQTAFADFFYDPFEQGLDGMLRSFIDTLRRMAAEIAAQQLLRSLFGSFEGSGGILGGFADAIAGSRDIGGRGEPGKVYAINPKAGPEYFVPDTAGRFIPNMGGSNTTVNVAIDARNNNDPGAILSLVPVIQSQIEQSLSLKMRRGYL